MVTKRQQRRSNKQSSRPRVPSLAATIIYTVLTVFVHESMGPPHLIATLVVGGGGDLGHVLGVVGRSLMLKFFFGLVGGIDEVVATMAHWNNVSPASPYLINVSGVGEEAMRVGVVRLFSFLWILTVGVSFKGSCLLVYGGTYVISLFVLIYGKVRFLVGEGVCRWPNPLLLQCMFQAPTGSMRGRRRSI